MPFIPKFVPAEIRDWIENVIAPRIGQARASGNWEFLCLKHFCQSPLFFRACRLFTGKSSAWYELLPQIGVSSEEILLIRDAGKNAIRSATANHNRTAKRAFSQAEIDEWLEISVRPKLHACSWNELIAKNWAGDPHFRSACGIYGKEVTDWYGVLSHLGATVEQVSLIRTVGQKIRQESGGVTRQSYSRVEIDNWISEKILPLILLCREQNSWVQLTYSRWTEDPHFSRACSLYGNRSDDWYGVLSLHVRDEELQKIREAGQSERKGGKKNRKYTLEDVSTWFQAAVMPAIEAARRTGDWRPLISTRWQEDEHFNSAVKAFGGTWYSLLNSHGVSDPEQSLIRKAGRESTNEQLRVPRFSLGSSAIVVEAMLRMRDSHEYDPRLFIRSVEQCMSLPLFLDADTLPQRPRIVIEYMEQEVRRSELEKVRILFGRNSSETTETKAAMYSRCLPRLATYLTSRLFVIHLCNLAEQGILEWPKDVLSTLSAPGDIQDAFEMIARSRGFSVPTVNEVDRNDILLDLTHSANRYRGDPMHLPIEAASMDCYYCGSFQQLRSGVELSKALVEAQRVLKPGGIIMLKVEDSYLGADFEEGIRLLGFNLLTPFNGRMTYPTGLTLTEQEEKRVRQILSSTHFLIARSTGAALSKASPQMFNFVRRVELDDEQRIIKELLRRSLRSGTDLERIRCIQEVNDVVLGLSQECIRKEAALLLGLLKHGMRTIFHNEEVGPLPKNRTENKIREEAERNRKMLETEINRNQGRNGDIVCEFLRPILSAISALETCLGT